MDPFDTTASILRSRVSDHRTEGAEHREEGRLHQAAESYRDAADALEALAQLRDVDRTEDVAQLRRAARQLESGQPLKEFPEESNPDDWPGSNQSEDPDSSGKHTNDEFRAVAESFISSTDATWDDVGGLESVVRLIKRSVAIGAADTPRAVGDTKGILLHGPPGTGKTLLAAAVAGSLGTTFFEVNTGNLLSKYFGESSKQISALFEVARELAPSVIFLDEVDALTKARGDDTNGAARRVLDTLLSELDGLDSGADEFVLPLASTNTPWDLDRAVRRRFEQRIYVPLPDVAAAEEITRIHSVEGGIEFESADPGAYLPADALAEPGTSVVGTIAAECAARGFSGHDIEVLCKEAIHAGLFRSNAALEQYIDEGDITALQEHDVTVPPVPPADIVAAFETVSPSLSGEELEQFVTWDSQYGTSL